MKKLKNILWGLLLIAGGVMFALKALDVIDFSIFFDGWWTLIIIIPCIVGLFTEHDKIGNLIGLLIGVFLLLCCQDILDFQLLWKLLIPAVVVVVGLKLVISGLFGNKANELISKMKADGKAPKACCATFSQQTINFNGEVFDGAELDAIFGEVKCDLSTAVIERDCAIQISSIFGSVSVMVPENVNVKVNSNSIFGGVSNKTNTNNFNTVTVYVNATCMFGGVEIK